MPLREVSLICRRGFYQAPRRIHGGRHLVSLVGEGRQTLFTVDGRNRQRGQVQLGRRSRGYGTRDDSRRRSSSFACRPRGNVQEFAPPLRVALPLRQPRGRRRVVLWHVLPSPPGYRRKGRHQLRLAVAGSVCGLSLVDGLRQKLARDAMYAGEPALWRTGAPGRCCRRRRRAISSTKRR